jgi:hypothetical protein
MCDYSLQNVNSRKADVADKLIVRSGGLGTNGFFAQGEGTPTAVCLIPGTEIAFDKAPKCWTMSLGTVQKEHMVAIFRQVDKHIQHCHHDALEFPDGSIVMLTHLEQGQTATVLQLPAEPTNDEEAKEQERVVVIERSHEREYDLAF